MNIAVLGTGSVGQTIAAKLMELGHTVMLGTRNPAETRARTQPNTYGQPGVGEWLRQHPQAQLGTYPQAARHGEIVFNATSALGSLEALRQAGEDNLNGKILIDLSNPLDFSHGMPPTLFVSNTDSLGEQIQRALPQAKVVKTLNTITANLMVNPSLIANGEHTLFVSGNDPAAKAQVSAWLSEWFGWQDILDLGDITSARAAEMYMALWMRLWGAIGDTMLNVRVVR